MELKEKSNIVSGELYQRQFDTIVTSKLVEERQQVAPNPYAAMACSSMAPRHMMMDMMMECAEVRTYAAAPMRMMARAMRA